MIYEWDLAASISLNMPEVSFPSCEKLQPALTKGRSRMLLMITEANTIFLRLQQSITKVIFQRSDQQGR